MPCGCRGGPPAQLPQMTPARSAPVTAARVAVYEVVVDGDVVVSTASPTAAREEARRLGASIRVTSRPV